MVCKILTFFTVIAVDLVRRHGTQACNDFPKTPTRHPHRQMWATSQRWSGPSNPIESDLGAVDLLIYNAGKGVWGSAEEVTSDDFEAAWRTNTFGAFAAARSVIPAMKRRAAGHIIFIGATASRRGGAKTAAFASAKAAQRSLAESLARSLGPSGIHVSRIIIDGIVDEPSTRTKLTDKLDTFFVKPDDIADTALMLTRQKPSAWT